MVNSVKPQSKQTSSIGNTITAELSRLVLPGKLISPPNAVWFFDPHDLHIAHHAQSGQNWVIVTGSRGEQDDFIRFNAVSRYGNQKVDPGFLSWPVDFYDFRQLAAGFTTDTFQLIPYSVDGDCPFVVTYRQDFGTWAGNWGDSLAPNDIAISVADTVCSGLHAASIQR